MANNLTDTDKKNLLILARQSIEEGLNKNTSITLNEEVKRLSEKRGVFVTLTKKKELRGCIGNILPEKELYLAVINNAVSSAFEDPRFPGLKKSELLDVEIEISILSVPEILDYSDYTDLKSKITEFKDGVILDFGIGKSTFLPQVWEQLPDFDLFMSHLSLKAGMSHDSWKTLKPKVSIYQADHFSESEFF